MNLVIIGTGNTAHILGRKFRAAGHRILQVAGRQAAPAAELAQLLGAEAVTGWQGIRPGADLYLVSVSDNALPEVAGTLRLPGQVVAHTAASVPCSVLEPVSERCGVFYPLQTLRKEMTALPDIPVYIDGRDEAVLAVLDRLGRTIAYGPVTIAGDAERLTLHLAAVLVSNFTNHLYALAEQFCRQEGIVFEQLVPLIHQTALRMGTIRPQAAQTGPAIRRDDQTLRRHEQLLSGHPELLTLYRMFTGSIRRLQEESPREGSAAQ
ncbi:MAG TPA: Rossmann-like and DUF2520 domain-containing protein [Chitinophagaceae bacterium]|nr:Rossmann-like and DUF2520 domain-containing protein [Chitinophagaceae bacterium]